MSGFPIRWVSMERLKEMAEARAKYRCPHCDLALNEDAEREMLYCWCGFARTKARFHTDHAIVEVKS